ncbi:hypothetical protein HDU76_007841, partial [Blyttiomyces sp. JEL0837]
IRPARHRPSLTIEDAYQIRKKETVSSHTTETTKRSTNSIQETPYDTQRFSVTIEIPEMKFSVADNDNTDAKSALSSELSTDSPELGKSLALSIVDGRSRSAVSMFTADMRKKSTLSMEDAHNGLSKSAVSMDTTNVQMKTFSKKQVHPEFSRSEVSNSSFVSKSAVSMDEPPTKKKSTLSLKDPQEGTCRSPSYSEAADQQKKSIPTPNDTITKSSVLSETAQQENRTTYPYKDNRRRRSKSVMSSESSISGNSISIQPQSRHRSKSAQSSESSIGGNARQIIPKSATEDLKRVSVTSRKSSKGNLERPQLSIRDTKIVGSVDAHIKKAIKVSIDIKQKLNVLNLDTEVRAQISRFFFVAKICGLLTACIELVVFNSSEFYGGFSQRHPKFLANSQIGYYGLKDLLARMIVALFVTITSSFAMGIYEEHIDSRTLYRNDVVGSPLDLRTS